jgi:ABC-type Zn uptake system ZnuABC Zn-binding protein ZnuA
VSGLPPEYRRGGSVVAREDSGSREASAMRRPSRWFARVGFTAVISLASLPSITTAGAGAPAKLPVVTSITVLADLVGKVGDDRVEVRALAPAGTDPHTFQPTPSSIKTLSAARVVFFNGSGLEEWGNRILKSVAARDLRVIELSQGLATLQAPGGQLATRTPEPDPHVWLDPILTKSYIERIRDTLSRVDPVNQASYTDHARAYQAKLDELDAWIRTEVDTIPPTRRKLVTFHDAFQYFAKRYGLEVKGFVVTSPGKEPSAKTLAELTRRIKQEQIPAVFAEADFNAKLLQVLARDAGVKVVTNLYDGSLSNGPPAESYINLMKHNVAMIVGALR